ncbi:alpha/beta hydrolase fold domain-containing protein [Clostridium sp.]|uniref:alpha/beta hydrolase fold domain-containing protein n=1 Tax=Clostridium sp. TaxID=1506 RepID=UPI0034394741
MAIAGDSAGGNFVAAVALRARDEGIPMIALQVLIYPCIAVADASIEGYKWSKEAFYIAESHKNLPKEILVGAEFDGLTIQTEFYAKQLKDSGVDVTCYRYKGMTHEFIDRLGLVPQAEDLANIISEAIKDLE